MRRPLSFLVDAATTLFGVGFLASSLSLGALYVGQRALIFPRPKLVAPCKEAIRIDSETVCAYFPPPNKDAPVLVFWHGNADQIGWTGSWLGHQLRGQAGFLAVEYPGYGASSSSSAPSEASIFDASDRAMEYLQNELGIDSERICLVGQSVGCGPALYVAKSWAHRSLVLVSPFESIPSLASQLLPIPRILLDAMVKDPFRNDLRAPSVASRTLVVHGTSDEIVPFSHGQTIASLLQNGQLLPVRGATHNDIFDPRYEVIESILTFCSTPTK